MITIKESTYEDIKGMLELETKARDLHWFHMQYPDL